MAISVAGRAGDSEERCAVPSLSEYRTGDDSIMSVYGRDLDGHLIESPLPRSENHPAIVTVTVMPQWQGSIIQGADRAPRSPRAY